MLLLGIAHRRTHIQQLQRGLMTISRYSLCLDEMAAWPVLKVLLLPGPSSIPLPVPVLLKTSKGWSRDTRLGVLAVLATNGLNNLNNIVPLCVLLLKHTAVNDCNWGAAAQYLDTPPHLLVLNVDCAFTLPSHLPKCVSSVHLITTERPLTGSQHYSGAANVPWTSYLRNAIT